MIEADEKILKERFGKKQPFSVPDGYFDRFAADMMSRLPQTPAAPAAVHLPVRHLWRRVALAAAFVGVAATASMVYLHGNTAPDTRLTARKAVPVQTPAGISYECSSLDMAADYTMLDNDDIYAMVSENQ